MIHRVKTVTWEVRSHGQETLLSNEGEMLEANWGIYCIGAKCLTRKSLIKKTIWHLQDVLKCMRQIEKEKEARKEKQEKKGAQDERD